MMLVPQHIDSTCLYLNFFEVFVCSDVTAVHGTSEDEEGLNHKVKQFSATFSRLHCKGNDAEANSPDCADKVALPENKPPQGESFSNGCGYISDSSTNLQVP